MDLDFLMRGLQGAADQILSPGAVDVLIQQAVYRR